MAEDFDLDRVINDPAYRRRIIARLNGLSFVQHFKFAPKPLECFTKPRFFASVGGGIHHSFQRVDFLAKVREAVVNLRSAGERRENQ